MHSAIQVRFDSERGCGWRKEGGLYLVSGEAWDRCGKLPVPLVRCPCCGGGVKPTRGWTWVDVPKLTAEIRCKYDSAKCDLCLINRIGRSGLLWCGEQFYKTPERFLSEAIQQGISRRISAIPRDFKVGETPVLIAHRKAIIDYVPEEVVQRQDEDAKDQDDEEIVEVDEQIELHPLEGEAKTNGKLVPVYTAGIICVFIPHAIEYVCKGDETDEFIEGLLKRGIMPVKVIRMGEPEQKQLLETEGNPHD